MLLGVASKRDNAKFADDAVSTDLTPVSIWLSRSKVSDLFKRPIYIGPLLQAGRIEKVK